MKSIQKLNLQEITYPKCLIHDTQELNQACIEDGCFFQFHPTCLLCQYDKDYRCTNHQKKPLCFIFQELEELSERNIIQSIEFTNQWEEDMNLLSKQFKNLGQKCQETAQNIEVSISKYIKTLQSLAPETKQIKLLLQNIEGDPSAQSMRLHLIQAKQCVKISESGYLELNLDKEEQIERVSSRFTRYSDKLSQIYQEISKQINSSYSGSIFYSGIEFSRGSSEKKQNTQESRFVSKFQVINQPQESNIIAIKIIVLFALFLGEKQFIQSPIIAKAKILDESSFIKTKIYKEGDSTTYPKPRSKVKINYKIFDECLNLLEQNKDGEPFTFIIGIGQVIQGWELAIPEMSLGEKALIKCSKQLINNSKYQSLFSTSSSLYFEIEILSIF